MSTPNFQPLNARIRVLGPTEMLRTEHFVKCTMGWQRLSPKNYLIGMRVAAAKSMAGATFVFGEEILEGSRTTVTVQAPTPVRTKTVVADQSGWRPAEPSSIIVED